MSCNTVVMAINNVSDEENLETNPHSLADIKTFKILCRKNFPNLY